jgi:hypothetical protein
LAVVLTALTLVAVPASAGVTEPRTDDPDRTLVATGTARVRGVPDVLTMTLGVTTRGATVGEALDRNNASARRVLDVVRDAGVDDEDVQTSNFAIGPVYDDRGDAVTGYQVSNLLTVRIRSLEKAGGIVDAVARAGGDDAVMRGVAFTFDDTSDLVARARAEAVRRARGQAEQLAGAAGVELVAVRTISESSADFGPVLDAPTSSDEAAASRAPIEPGTDELSVQVRIVYTIR